jgi:NhaP-type Na+/H+ or K+/H+ antiporter
VIFLLSGLIIGHTVYARSEFLNPLNIGDHAADRVRHLYWPDVGYAVLTYTVVCVGRFLMIFLFYPILARTGYGITWQGATVLSWGGIHGAVGLALAILLDVELKQKNHGVTDIDGSRIMLHVGLVTVLTLVINGVFCSPLLSLLGLTAKDPSREVCTAEIMARVEKHKLELITKR